MQHRCNNRMRPQGVSLAPLKTPPPFLSARLPLEAGGELKVDSQCENPKANKEALVWQCFS